MDSNHETHYTSNPNEHDVNVPDDDSDHSYPTIEEILITRKIYIAIAIISTVINIALLLTVISKHSRPCPLYWYIYNMILVILMQTVFVFIFMVKKQTEFSIGFCKFMLIAVLAVNVVNRYSLILMDIEIIRMFAPESTCGGAQPILRFAISLTGMWILSTAFSVLVFLVGHTDEWGSCYVISSFAVTTSVIMVFNQVLPWVVAVVCVLVGCLFFIRAKRIPGTYDNGTNDHTSSVAKKELFVFFIVWNGLDCFQELVKFVLDNVHILSGRHRTNIGYMVCSIIHIVLPILCILLYPTRSVIKNTWRLIVNN